MYRGISARRNGKCLTSRNEIIVSIALVALHLILNTAIAEISAWMVLCREAVYDC